MKKLALCIPLVVLLVGCMFSAQPTPTIEPALTVTPTETAAAAMPVATSTATPVAKAASTATPIVDAASTATPAAADPLWDWADLSPYKQAMLPDFVADVDRMADVTRYVIDLHVNPAAASFRGRERVRYTNQESVRLDEIVFRLLPQTPGYGGQMQVEAVEVAGKPVSFHLDFQDSAVYVPLPTALEPGGQVELALDFSGTLNTDSSTGYSQYGYFNGVLTMPNAYPMIPVYDDEGWNVELAPTYGDATFADSALYLAHVTLPADWVVVSSGVIVERVDNGDGTATHTCASGLMRDFMLVASADYGQVDAQVGPVLVTSYYLPGDEKGGKLALDYTVHALRIYEQLFGPYPFTELDVAATPTSAGGIEYPGLFVIAERLYGQTGGFFEIVAVHEAAHQWWYSMVGSDQLDEPWLDEALTQYSSLLYIEHRYGPERAQVFLKENFVSWYQSIDAQAQEMVIGLPVAAYPEYLYGPIVYGKGPLFFHELRLQLGDEMFYEVLRTYLDQYRYGVAYPQDFVRIAEQVGGRELDALYQEWVGE